MIRVAGENAGLKNVHPHMLRHSCGYYLANTGVDLRIAQDYLGTEIRSIPCTTPALPGADSKDVWK